jgi:hypothetical protein
MLIKTISNIYFESLMILYVYTYNFKCNEIILLVKKLAFKSSIEFATLDTRIRMLNERGKD